MGVLGAALTVPATAQAQVITPCSTSALIAAINTANTGGPTTIVLTPLCVYSLTTPAETGTRGPDGLPIIRRSIEIRGNGATIRRTVGSPPFRILEVLGGGLTLSNLTIRGGDSGADTGGGVLVDGGTVFRATAVTFTGNQGDNGAALSGDTADVTLLTSRITGNTTTGGGAGAVYNDGSLLVQSSNIVDNTANTGGGGIYNEQGGVATVRNSVIQGNTARTTFGGGIVNLSGSTLRLQSSTVALNTAATDGGGIYNSGTLFVTSGSIFGNYASGRGGGIFNQTGGTVSLTSSTVARNQATSGGGIYNAAGPGSVTRAFTSIVLNIPDNCAPTSTSCG
ncbi:hypothetical protein [Actinomadura sp. WMMA1423]|uniref:hypothetical protein n=1 Tax=Actinomadura sp. WMMA1423 TaxID=2591108 RepID=UPI00143CFD25|nr:hypothetical protein [Actinomadura sp. WMMA1423]